MTRPDSKLLTRFRILRADRASHACPPAGTIVYPGLDGFGCANDDTRRTDIEHIACSVNLSGLPFFTIPREDCEPVYTTGARVPFPQGRYDEVYYQGLAWLDTL